MTVRMRYEGVEDEITVAEESVPFHAAAGWEVVEDESPADDTKTTDGEPDSKSKQSERPKASATRKKEN